MEAEARKTQVALLYLQGYTQCAIAAQLGCSEGCVCNDLADLKRVWQERAEEDRLRRIGEALAELDLLRSLLWKRGDLKLLLKAMDMRFRVLGAYRVDVHVSAGPAAALPWDEIQCDNVIEVDGGK